MSTRVCGQPKPSWQAGEAETPVLNLYWMELVRSCDTSQVMESGWPTGIHHWLEDCIQRAGQPDTNRGWEQTLVQKDSVSSVSLLSHQQPPLPGDCGLHTSHIGSSHFLRKFPGPHETRQGVTVAWTLQNEQVPAQKASQCRAVGSGLEKAGHL